ncbi:hypothetical protein MKW98_032443, partial [Papaver atlanticum]
MASTKGSSTTKGRIALKVKSSTSPVVPPTPSRPPPPPGLTLKIPLVYHRSTSLSPELKLLYDQVFKALPQTPHFNPLEKLSCTENMKEGLKLGLDVFFLHLIMKLCKPVDPFTFLSEVESYTKEFKGFEEYGYDLTKVKDRFNLLKRRAEQEKPLKDEVEKLEKEEKDGEANIEHQELRLK